MSVLSTIDVVLGVVLFYLLLSLICTAVTELIATLTRLRGTTLRNALANLFADEATLQKLYDFPLIRGLFRGTRLPAAIKPATFVTSLMHLLAGTSVSVTADALKEGINGLPDGSPIKDSLLVLIEDAKGNIENLSAAIETWFNAVMDRVSGWYKRRAQLITWVVSLVVVVAVNADTIQLVRATAQDAVLRNRLVEQAVTLAQQPSTPAAPQNLAAIGQGLTDIRQSGIPLGWAAAPVGGLAWVLKIAGLLLTAFAISLGAPFWFDLMRRVAGIRSSLPQAAGGAEKS